MSSLLESFSITCFWTNLSLKAQDTAIFWPKTELAILTSTKKNTTASMLMLSTFSKECSRKDQNSESLLIRPWSILLFVKLQSKRWKSKKTSNHSRIICSNKSKLSQWTLHRLSRVTVYRWAWERRIQAHHYTGIRESLTVFTSKAAINKTWQEWFQWKRQFQTCPKTPDQRVKHSRTRWLMKLTNINDLVLSFCFKENKLTFI